MSALKTYPISAEIISSDINASNLTKELKKSGHITGFIGIDIDDSNIKIRAASFSDEGACDTLVGSHNSFDLFKYKQLKFEAFKRRTDELILEGFDYLGKQYSMSIYDQINILGSNLKKNEGALPVTFNTVDNMDEVTFANPTDLDAFFLAAMICKMTHLNSSTDLKRLVRAANTKDAIDLIIDAR